VNWILGLLAYEMSVDNWEGSPKDEMMDSALVH